MNRLKIYTNEINRRILEFLGFENPKIIIEGAYNWKYARSHYAFEHYQKYRKMQKPIVLDVETNLSKSLKSEYFMHRVMKILARRFFEIEAKFCEKAREFVEHIINVLKLERTEINEESLIVGFYTNFQTEAFKNYEINVERNEILCKIYSPDFCPQTSNGLSHGTWEDKNETQCPKKSLNQRIQNQALLQF